MKPREPETFFDKISPTSFKSFLDLGLKGRSYRQLRLILFSTMLVIAMAPVLIVGGLGYSNYNELLRNSEAEQLEWQLDGKIKSIEYMLESLKSVVQFTARRDRYTELISGNELEELFTRIQRQYPFFADLGVIDNLGIQRAYYGPYELQGTNYANEEWFAEVTAKGLYISDVYTGHRQVPHFAIAVSNLDPKTRTMWVLRATIDASTLQQFINAIKTNASDDLFLIDGKGTLQTSSTFFGTTLAQFRSDFKVGIQHNLSDRGENIFQAIAKVKGSPWFLVLIKKRYIHHDDWKQFRSRLYFIVGACLVLSVLIVFTLVRFLTGLIKKSDEMQLAMLREAEHTNKLASIGRLAAGVGHEINNPLAIINQKTGLMEDLLELSGDFDHKATIQKCLQVVNQSVNRCKAITHRLLGFARRTEVYSEQLSVNDIIREVLQFLDNAMLYNRIKSELQLQPDLPLVVSDRLQLQQIFLNIINNAIDAIGKDGEISITSHRVAGDIRVVIQDDGPGIPDEVLPQIFEPFYTTKETGKGTGLGLSITYGLIKKLGGDITVRSHLGLGTAFTITIPLENESHEQQ